MRTQKVYAEKIDVAVKGILEVLKEKTDTTRTVSSRDNVLYCDGWDGLGASAVLRAIAQRLTSASADGKEFDQVIHIDCSMWQSRRALQRAVAQQLNLPSQVMALLDREDEEDDFRGVAPGSRAEVQQVLKEMQQHIQKLNRRFLASCCGFPLSGFSTSKVLWTFQGRFRLKPRTKVDMAMKSTGTTDVFIYQEATPDSKPWAELIRPEATEVVASFKISTSTGPHDDIFYEPAQVSECFLYMLELCCRGGHHSIDYDFSTHVANYWVCDGIIRNQILPQLQMMLGPQILQLQGDRDVGTDDDLWRAADALQREMPLDVDYHQHLPSSHLSKFVESKPYWTSPAHGFTQIPAEVMHSNVFQHCADRLSVLKLSHCTFDFPSPPFLCCHSLRFLWLDHCQGTKTSTDDVAGKEEDIRRCFQRLWVLDLYYTDCTQILSAQMLDLMTQLRELNVIGYGLMDMGLLRGRLPNIRKLRVKECSVRCSCSENDLFSEMNKMEHLDFSGNIPGTMTSLIGLGESSNICCLETVVIVDGCGGLQQISFRGCTKLKNLHLGGKMTVQTIDISGTAVKTLDLSTTTIPNLDELYLLDCENLCAILWPPKEQMKQEGLGKLCIDTTQSAATAQSREEKAKRGTSNATTGTSAAAAPHGNGPSSEFDWHISVRDARLLASLKPVYSDSRKAYVEIFSPPHPTIVGGGKDEGISKSASSGEQQLLVNLQRQPAPAAYTDISVDRLRQASEGGADTLGIIWMWPCPDVPDLPETSCYMHIQDQMRTKSPQGGEDAHTIIVPKLVTESAKILHVHDSLSITSITSDEYGSKWPYLEWCCIQRCPKLDFVFSSENILGIPTPKVKIYRNTKWMIYVRDEGSLCQLETLEIAWCGDLREIFPFNGNKPNSKDFPRLKRIHLHELPSLQHICEIRMSAPNLETVKIRGCWSLRCLPDVGSSNKLVECDCEKEWWDRLEWDDRSQADNYRPIHPRYYKKTLLMGSVLR